MRESFLYRFLSAFSIISAAVLGPAGTAMADLDGFGVASSTFAEQSNGSDIFDGASFTSPWALAGGGDAADYALSGSNLQLVSQSTNNTWVEQDGGGTPWNDGVGGSWTVEYRVKITDPTTGGGSAGDNELALWFDDDVNNKIFVVADNMTYEFEDVGSPLDVQSNSDAMHTFRTAYDKPNDVYHFWRDNVEITPLSGVGRRTGTTGGGDGRLIFGDCCTSAGQAGSFKTNSYELEYARFDMSGAYSPVAAVALTLEVDNLTGAASFYNDDAPIDFDIKSYAIDSAGGSLVPGDWTSLESQGVGDDGTPNNGIGFEVLTTPSANQLAEANLFGSELVADGGTTFSLGSIFSPGGAQDLVFTYTTADGQFLTGIVDYVTTPLGDMDGDGDVDVNDVDPFVQALTARAAYDAAGYGIDADLVGDMNQDGTFDLGDIADFAAAVNSPGSAAAAAVPEPTALALGCLGLLGALVARRRR